ATFGPAVFLWFVGIGGLTVAMAGGIDWPPRPGKAAAAETDREAAPAIDPAAPLGDPGVADLDEAEVSAADTVEFDPDVSTPAPPAGPPDAAAPIDLVEDPEEHFMVDDPDPTGPDPGPDPTGRDDEHR